MYGANKLTIFFLFLWGIHDFKVLILISINKRVEVDYGIRHRLAPLQKKNSAYATILWADDNIRIWGGGG